MPGAGGSCAGKWEAIRVLHSISHGRGPITDQTRAAPRAITWGKLWATKMVSGLFKVAMTCTPCGPGPDPSQAQSHSGAPKPDGRVDPGFHGALARSQASRPRGQERLRSSCPNPCSPRTRSPCGPADRNPFSSAQMQLVLIDRSAKPCRPASIPTCRSWSVQNRTAGAGGSSANETDDTSPR